MHAMDKKSLAKLKPWLGSQALAWGLLSAFSAPAVAGSVDQWDKASHLMAAGLPALAAGMTWQQGDSAGMQQLVLSLGSTLAATELLKSTVQARRPDGSDNKSFPSGHTAMAFSAAAFIERRHGDRLNMSNPAWVPALYGLAALTGLARVEARRHHWEDVLAGAAIGYGATRLWTEPVKGGRVSVLPAPSGLAVAWARVF